ncbi:MAG: hypothetical protein KHW47_02940, partial [Actinotignum schaalii]|nr:hypothetical protein [Actinotignum schaalii]
GGACVITELGLSTPNDETVLRVWHFLERHAATIFTAIAATGPVVFSISGGSLAGLPRWACLLSPLFGIPAFVVQNRQQVASASLQSDLEDALTEKDRMEELYRHQSGIVCQALDHLMARIANGLSRPGTVLRGSIYRHSGDIFFLVARWSSNPRLTQVGRRTIPDDKGILARAWETGFLARSKMPEDREEWNEVQTFNSGLTLEEAASLTLHARSIAAYRLEHQSQPVGVFVLESPSAQGVSSSTLDKLASLPDMATLALLISLPPHEVLPLHSLREIPEDA